MSGHRVKVEVATMWASPDSPRPVDAPAIADTPDLAAWAEAMDHETKLGLLGRVETQLVRGEPVELIENGQGGWVRVVAPWQPSPKDTRGYPGWIRRSHLEPANDSPFGNGPPAACQPDAVNIIGFAHRFLGVGYLWGGMTTYGVDCSGLVHVAFRLAGIVIPRDADAQHDAATPITIGDERPGDLYFFSNGGLVSHVGLVTGPLRVLHAPQTGALVEDARVSAKRRTALVAVCRFIPHL